MCVRMPFAVGGSGSTYIYGHCDSTYKVRLLMVLLLKYCIEVELSAMKYF